MFHLIVFVFTSSLLVLVPTSPLNASCQDTIKAQQAAISQWNSRYEATTSLTRTVKYLTEDPGFETIPPIKLEKIGNKGVLRATGGGFRTIVDWADTSMTAICKIQPAICAPPSPGATAAILTTLAAKRAEWFDEELPYNEAKKFHDTYEALRRGWNRKLILRTLSCGLHKIQPHLIKLHQSQFDAFEVVRKHTFSGFYCSADEQKELDENYSKTQKKHNKASREANKVFVAGAAEYPFDLTDCFVKDTTGGKLGVWKLTGEPASNIPEGDRLYHSYGPGLYSKYRFYKYGMERTGTRVWNRGRKNEKVDRYTFTWRLGDRVPKTISTWEKNVIRIDGHVMGYSVAKHADVFSSGSFTCKGCEFRDAATMS